MKKSKPKIVNEDRPLPLRKPERFKGNAYSPVFPSFIEKLFLAIAIPAHADENELRAERASHIATRNSISELFGIDCPQGKPPRHDTRLQFQAWLTETGGEEVVSREIGDVAPHLENHLIYRELGDSDAKDVDLNRRKAASQSENSGSKLDSVARRISDKIPDYYDYLLDVSGRELDEEEEEILKDLRALKEIFARWGIPLETDPIKLGLAAMMVPKLKNS